MTLSQEKIFYHYLRQNPSYFKYVHSYFFKDLELKHLLDIDKDFFQKYGSTASKNQVIQLIDKKKLEEFYTEDSDGNSTFNYDLISSIFDIDIDNYDQAWINENFETWIEWKTLENSMVDVLKFIKTSQVTTDNIKDIVATVKNTVNERNSLTFEESFGTDIDNIEDYTLDNKESFPTGYSWIDEKLGGGLTYKTLTVFFANAKAGKSLVLGNLAVNLQRNGYNVLVVSLELSEKKYLKRIAANIHNIPVAEYDLFIEDKKKLRKKIENHTQMDGITMKIPGKLIIKEFPADSLKVSELEAYIFKLESQLKLNFDVLIVDYLNLLVDYKNPSSESTYLKVKNIAVSLRALAMRKNLAAISATQAVRGASEKSGALSMADVSESIGLPQTVDALFSISKDMMDQANNTLTFGAVALRDAEGMGETHQFDFDKKYLRITQKLEDCNQNLNLDCFSLMN